MELYERIRRDRRVEGVSIRGLADRYGVHRRTVRQALASATPSGRKTAERASPALGPYKDTIRGWLTVDLDVPRKQRHTARRVWQRLVDEHDARVAEPTVRAFVAEVKAELANTAGDVTVVQEHAPGADAEVDFGEFRARIAGQLLVLHLFVMRLSASGRGFAAAFAHQAQEAFFEGHVLAFAHFGGVPTGLVRYDNLMASVLRILVGCDRSRTNGSSRCARITGSTRSTARPASRVRTRRAAWRARSAGSAAAISSRCLRSTRSTISTPISPRPWRPMTAGGSAGAARP